jgi:purine catabolism regulator
MEASERLDAAYTPLTVADALADPALAGTRVVAGTAGLAREIADVGVLDLGEVDALRPGQLVLSSAYPLQETRLEHLFQAFRRARVCAFGVKMSGFWTDMPAELVAASDAAELPLLELPPGRFEDIVNPVLKAIAERQAERLRRSAGLHRALTEAAFRDQTPAGIARVVMHALGRPVAVFDRRGELLTSTGPPTLWTAPELPARATAVDDAVDLEVDGTTYLVAPVVASRRHCAAVCVAGASAGDSFARSAVVQATVVLAMQIVGQHGVETLHRRFERELVDDLADGRVSGTEARARARRVGWPVRRPYVILVAQRRPPSLPRVAAKTAPAVSDAELAAFSRAIGTTPAGEVRLFRRRAGLAVVLHLAERHDAGAAVEEIGRTLAAARSVPWAAAELVIGASRLHRGLAEFSAAFREAALAAGLASAPGLRWYDDLGPARLVAAIDDDEALLRMASEILDPIAHVRGELDNDLLETLAVLLAHNMRLSEASAELFFHYNTVRHRLGRLRQALGARLETPADRMTLILALTALRVRAAKEVAAPAAAHTGGRPKNAVAAAP